MDVTLVDDGRTTQHEDGARILEAEFALPTKKLDPGDPGGKITFSKYGCLSAAGALRMISKFLQLFRSAAINGLKSVKRVSPLILIILNFSTKQPCCENFV